MGNLSGLITLILVALMSTTKLNHYTSVDCSNADRQKCEDQCKNGIRGPKVMCFCKVISDNNQMTNRCDCAPSFDKCEKDN